MDPQEQLWRVRVRLMAAGTDELETRVVTKDELETLRRTNVTIENVEIVKDPGSVGLFRGSTARSLDILVSQTAENRTSVATLYGLQRDSLRETAFEKENRKARLIKVDGIIDRLQESFLIRQIGSAVADGAQVIVFEIDSRAGCSLPVLPRQTLLRILNLTRFGRLPMFREKRSVARQSSR